MEILYLNGELIIYSPMLLGSGIPYFRQATGFQHLVFEKSRKWVADKIKSPNRVFSCST